MPIDGTSPKFAQIYIYDIEKEVSNRVQLFNSSRKQSEIDNDIVNELIKILYENNLIVKAFRIARDRFRQSDVSQAKLRLIGDRFNWQNSKVGYSKIARLIVGDVD